MLTPREARGLASSDLFGPVEVPCPSADDPDLPLPDRIGPFRVIRRVASGGMGTVYEAEQEQPRRRVAVKVLRPGVVSRETLRRFQAEVEILGKLQHPGIAQIFDAGTYDDGGGAVPWFAMEFIDDGLPITDFADQQKLDRLQRLNLFLQVCDAVQHGHVRGVIHRDLKPENILVTRTDDTNAKGASAMARVIDFGVARSMGDGNPVTTMLTRSGQVLGTLPYMSPEQCDGNGDTRTDVYALGVLLYRLLTGRLPFDVSAKSVTTAIRIIQEEEPTNPRIIDRSLRGGLASIILKSLEKDPNRRYQSVGELANDVRAWMGGEPVTARPPGVWMRFGRVMRRHMLVTTSVAAVLIGGAIVGSSLVTAWWLGSRPSYVLVDEERTVARLLSVGGHVLRVWNTESRNFIRAAGTASDSSHRFAFVAAVGKESGTNEQLEVYRFPQYKVPVWTTVTAEPTLTQPPLYFEFPEGAPLENLEDGYTVHQVLEADVFYEIDGPELIVVHKHFCCSPWAIRVYSLADGDVLYEAWHLGMIREVHWLADKRRIVALADRHVMDDVAQFGWDDPSFNGHKIWPRVMFALTPRLKMKLPWFNPIDDPGLEGHLEWYKVLLPRKSVDLGVMKIHRPANPNVDSSKVLELAIGPRNGDSFTVYVTDDGNIAGTSWGDSTTERIKEGQRIEFDLVDWPPDREIVDTPIRD